MTLSRETTKKQGPLRCRQRKEAPASVEDAAQNRKTVPSIAEPIVGMKN